MALRDVWASTRKHVLHGEQGLAGSNSNAVAAFGPKVEGVIASHPLINLETAMLAFDQVLANPGRFSIGTIDGSDIDFLFSGPLMYAIAGLMPRRMKPQPIITLDIWFSDPPRPYLNDVLSVTAETARGVITRLFNADEDGELWNYLRFHQ